MTLKELRLQKGYKLREVAEDLKISLSAISKYETGVSPVASKIREKFAKYYGVNVEDINFDLNEHALLKEENKLLEQMLKEKEDEIKQLIKSHKEEIKEKDKELKEYKDYISNLESQINNFNSRMRRMQALMKSAKYRRNVFKEGGGDM